MQLRPLTLKSASFLLVITLLALTASNALNGSILTSQNNFSQVGAAASGGTLCLGGEWRQDVTTATGNVRPSKISNSNKCGMASPGKYNCFVHICVDGSCTSTQCWPYGTSLSETSGTQGGSGGSGGSAPSWAGCAFGPDSVACTQSQSQDGSRTTPSYGPSPMSDSVMCAFSDQGCSSSGRSDPPRQAPEPRAESPAAARTESSETSRSTSGESSGSASGGSESSDSSGGGSSSGGTSESSGSTASGSSNGNSGSSGSGDSSASAAPTPSASSPSAESAAPAQPASTFSSGASSGGSQPTGMSTESKMLGTSLAVSAGATAGALALLVAGAPLVPVYAALAVGAAGLAGAAYLTRW